MNTNLQDGIPLEARNAMSSSTMDLPLPSIRTVAALSVCLGLDWTHFVEAAMVAPTSGADNNDAISVFSTISNDEVQGSASFGLYGGAIDCQLTADVRRQFNVDDGHGRDDFLNALRLVTEEYVARLRPARPGPVPSEFLFCPLHC